MELEDHRCRDKTSRSNTMLPEIFRKITPKIPTEKINSFKGELNDYWNRPQHVGELYNNSYQSINHQYLI